MRGLSLYLPNCFGQKELMAASELPAAINLNYFELTGVSFGLN